MPYPDVLNAIMDSPKPVIAAINGAAFAGGLGLVGAADIVITKEDVQFSFSEVRMSYSAVYQSFAYLNSAPTMG